MLKLGANKIRDLTNNVFRTLRNLERLDLFGNQLTTIHSDSFGIHRYLKEINLSGNKINAIDEKFIDNTAVNRLEMRENICSQEKIEGRDEMKRKLDECFKNYKPRVEQSKLELS